MNHYVYETTNLINGKKYIGKRSCKCPIEDDKYMGSGIALKNAIAKYNINNFKKEILCICENEEQAYEWEKFYIEQVSAYKNEKYYNIARGGEGFSSSFVKDMWKDEKYRNKITDKSKKMWQDDKHREKISLSMKKNWENYEYRERLTKSIRESKSKEVRSKHSSAMKKRWQGEQYKTKTLSEIKERWKDIEYRNKVAKSIKKTLNTPESRARISEATKKKWQNETYRANQIKRMTGANHSQAIKVVLVNTGEIFNFIKEASESKKVCRANISRCCDGLREYAGDDGSYFYKWMYYKDYIELSEDEILDIKKNINKYSNPHNKKVVLINIGKIFNSINEGSQFLNLKSPTGVSECCKGKRAWAGKINGEPARWMYYEDYLKMNE